MTKYARDEFDRIPEASARQGVHRTVSTPSARRLIPILAVGVAALAIGLVAFLLLPKLGFGPGTGSLSADQAGSNAAASQAPSAGAKPSASSKPTATPSPAASTPAASATPSATVDKTQPVTIYNGTATAGLAGRVASTVTAAGWTPGQVGNWSGAPQQTSVVFYNGAAQKAGAEELGSLLGISTLVDSADFQLPLVVVLGPGFK